MSVIPPSKEDMIAFFASHVPVWTAKAAEIGLSPEATAELAALLSDAQSKLAAQAAKSDEKKSATQAANQAAAALREAGAGDLATIKAFAKATKDPSVYVKAQIPEPADRTPAPPPSMPYDLDAGLDNDGNVVLTFKSDSGSSHTGVFFQIRRKLDSESSFSIIGSTGTKSFTDQAIASGTTSVVYNVTARRGELASPTSENIYVPFASGNGNPVSIKTATPKPAATTKKKDSGAA
ncbi:MAG: hypothetical protein ACIAS6_15105 [Phycisphaerales bacterium JB060]